jgi:hypothetical protein
MEMTPIEPRNQLQRLLRERHEISEQILNIYDEAISRDPTALTVAFPVLLAAPGQNLLDPAQAITSMLAMIDEAKLDADADPRLWAPFVVVREPAKPR